MGTPVVSVIDPSPRKSDSWFSVVLLLIFTAAISGGISYLLLTYKAAQTKEISNTSPIVQQLAPTEVTQASISNLDSSMEDEVNPFSLEESSNPFDVFLDETEASTSDYQNPF